MRRLFSFLTLFLLLAAAPAVAQERPPEKRTAEVAVPDGFELGGVFTTADETAKASEGDYQAQEDPATFAPGAETVSVEILEDTKPERDETFLVRFTNGLDTQDVRVTVTDDDAPAVELVAAKPAAENDPGAAFAVVNPTVVDRPVSVAYSVAGGTATAGADFSGASGRVTVPAGQPGVLLGVPYVNDNEDEDDESFTTTIGDPQGATIAAGKAQATGTIVNDDLRALSIGDGSAREADGDNAVTRVPVTLSGPTFRTVTVQYATLDGVARAPIDYLSRLGTLTFAPGQTTQFVDLALVSDERREPTEIFGVLLGRPQGATILDGGGVVAVQDDDEQPNPDEDPPSMKVSAPKLRGRSVSVRVSCPSGETRCQGRLTLFTVADRKAKAKSLRRERRLGAKSYALRGGQARTLTMTLSKTVLAAGRASGRLRVRAYALTRDAADNVDTTERPATLKLKRMQRASASR